jgi:colanic acid/amylovoran biosynthesis glycosyltransferase
MSGSDVERLSSGSSSDARPVVASYCATFLKPETLHIYRQIAGLQRFRPLVIARKRENADRFPFEPVVIIRKSPTHFLRWIWLKQICRATWRISNRERDALVRVLNSANAQLLHIYFGHIAVHLLPLIRTWPKPAVVSFHGADVMVDMDKPAFRAATTEMLRSVRLVLVRSESLRRAVVQLGCDEGKIRIHRAGIPLDEFAFRTRVWPTDGRWKLVQACRLIGKKGLRTSLRAFTEFVRQNSRSHFVIAGEGPMRDELEQLARDLGIEQHISFAGFVSQSELRDLYYTSHIFLHPSEVGSDGNQEGVPNSMLEAMASGLPVFATTHGGIPEAIENGISGVLVSEGDHIALAKALSDSTADPAKLSEIAQRGAEAVAQKFEQREQVRQLENFYREAIGVAS